MKRIIQDKIRYYITQKDKFTEKYLESTKRSDRDTLMKVVTRISVYREMIELIDSEKLQ